MSLSEEGKSLIKWLSLPETLSRYKIRIVLFLDKTLEWPSLVQHFNYLRYFSEVDFICFIFRKLTWSKMEPG